VPSKPQSPDPLEPFFADARTIQEKLAAVEREYRAHQSEHECPPIIAGLVLELGEYFSEYAEGAVPTVRVLDRFNTVWSVIAFHGRLRWEIEKTAPRVGDFMAIAYRGVIPSKKKGMNDSYDYAVAVERNPELVDVETNSRGNEVLAGSDPVPSYPDDDDVLDDDVLDTVSAAGQEEGDDAIPF
jgi:hypothetical protein